MAQAGLGGAPRSQARSHHGREGQPGSQELSPSLRQAHPWGLCLLLNVVLGSSDPWGLRHLGTADMAHRYCCRVSHRPALVSRSLVARTRTMLMKRMKLSCGSEAGLHAS